MNSDYSRFTKWSMMFGNLFEHYDTALFSLLSPFLATLFFPGQDPLTALILTYGIMPLGMIARPIGSLVFGYIGDTKGRKEALVISLLGMAFVTACMGFMPTHYQVGFLAPLFLSLGRICQNFFAAGETVGGAIYLIENSPESQHDNISSVYGASTVAGILLASLGVSLLCVFDLVLEYWRILYFIGCSTAIFACLLRMKIKPNHSVPIVKKTPPLFSTLKSCWEYRYPLMTIAIAAGFSYASYTVALVMINGLVPLVSNITKDQMMHLNTFLLIIDFFLLPCFGFLTNRFSREKMMMIAGAVALVSGFPLFGYLQGANFLTVIIIRFFLVVIGVWFSAPFYSWAQTLVPAAQRYTVISFGYAIGSQLLGGPTAAISLWLFQQTHWIASAAWYWMALGLLISFLIAKKEIRSAEIGVFTAQEG